jgi:hypothetical protein
MTIGLWIIRGKGMGLAWAQWYILVFLYIVCKVTKTDASTCLNHSYQEFTVP